MTRCLTPGEPSYERDCTSVYSRVVQNRKAASHSYPHLEPESEDPNVDAVLVILGESMERAITAWSTRSADTRRSALVARRTPLRAVALTTESEM